MVVVVVVVPAAEEEGEDEDEAAAAVGDKRMDPEGMDADGADCDVESLVSAAPRACVLAVSVDNGAP